MSFQCFNYPREQVSAWKESVNSLFLAVLTPTEAINDQWEREIPRLTIPTWNSWITSLNLRSSNFAPEIGVVIYFGGVDAWAFELQRVSPELTREQWSAFCANHMHGAEDHWYKAAFPGIRVTEKNSMYFWGGVLIEAPRTQS